MEWNGPECRIRSNKEPYPERDHFWTLLQKDAPRQIDPSGLSAEDSFSILETARTGAFCLSQRGLVPQGEGFMMQARSSARRKLFGLVSPSINVVWSNR